VRNFFMVAPFLVWRSPAYHMQAKGAATFNLSVQQIPGHPLNLRRALEEGITYDCPWDDFRFMYFKGKDSDTAARELVAWAQPRGIKVEFELRREFSLDVIYVLLKAR
jgi:hypothetical protein